MSQEEKKQTLGQMLSVLQIMEHDIDTADEITLDMCEEHFAQIKSVDEKVDRLLGYMEMAEQQSESLKKRSDELRAKAKGWSKKYERLKEYAIYLANLFPEVQGRGNERTYYKRLNAPSLVVDLEYDWSCSHVIDPELVDKVPEKYRTKKELWILDAAKLKGDMKISAETYDWARLEQKPNIKVEEKTRRK